LFYSPIKPCTGKRLLFQPLRISHRICYTTPDFAGARPKLQGQGEGFHDYGIRDETNQGLPGLINLIVIEFPGLTASPAIAKYVAEIVAEKFS
jgi:L-2-hydroxyglutarate oxidase LhgO